jgi:hypothetical protein
VAVVVAVVAAVADAHSDGEAAAEAAGEGGVGYNIVEAEPAAVAQEVAAKQERQDEAENFAAVVDIPGEPYWGLEAS